MLVLRFNSADSLQSSSTQVDKSIRGEHKSMNLERDIIHTTYNLPISNLGNEPAKQRVNTELGSFQMSVKVDLTTHPLLIHSTGEGYEPTSASVDGGRFRR
jgi:hypothetical protein